MSGGLISWGIFTFVQSSKAILNFSIKSERVEGSDCAHFFQDETKVKIPSDIKPHLNDDLNTV